MFKRLKRVIEPVTEDEGSARRMQELFALDQQESKRGDIRAKFDSGFIPDVHPVSHRPQGPEGWVDADGVLHPFDHYEDGPSSIDATREEEVV